jgi:hypothetical protein
LLSPDGEFGNDIKRQILTAVESSATSYIIGKKKKREDDKITEGQFSAKESGL